MKRSPKQLWSTERNYRARGHLSMAMNQIACMKDLDSTSIYEVSKLQTAYEILENLYSRLKNDDNKRLSYQYFCERRGIKL